MSAELRRLRVEPAVVRPRASQRRSGLLAHVGFAGVSTLFALGLPLVLL